MESKIKKCYISKLLKIKHKPILIEYILSFIRNNPNILIELIKEDNFLKAHLNKLFNKLKKNINLNPELILNLNLLLIYKQFIRDIKHEINYESLFLDIKNKNIIDPSFISFYTNSLIDKIESNKNSFIKNNFPSRKQLNDIIYTRYGNDFNFEQMAFLPQKEVNGIPYTDGLYIQNKLNNSKNIKYIKTLYCIIDNNEYYNKIESLNDNIIIDSIYFIFKNNNKNIDIYKAINIYLTKINNINNIKGITFGKGFFEKRISSFYSLNLAFGGTSEYYLYEYPIMDFLDKDVFVKKNKLKIPYLQYIKLKNEEFIGDDLKLYLGISLLTNNDIIIDNVNIINSKNYKNKSIEIIEKKYVLIKIHTLSILKTNDFIDIVNEFINKSSNVILYFSDNIKINNKIEKLVIENQKFYLNLQKQNFLFYSECPIKYDFEFYDNSFFKYDFVQNSFLNIVRKNNKLILGEYFKDQEKYLLEKTKNSLKFRYIDNIIDFLFLFEKYKEINLYSYNNNFNNKLNYPNNNTINKSEREKAINNYLKNKYNIDI